MVPCRYKKAFLKDLAKIHPDHRRRVEVLVFERIPASKDIFNELDIRKIQGYRDYYRIRVGEYRIGCRIRDGVLTFYRVKRSTVSSHDESLVCYQ
ncbi:MAG: type II toxin-antitoxin system RelE/ParE family toxin [Methanomicrobiales archaeon]|nr:type II toxin-antitoxin system RelE/ParE family toxin [Methanomicrobiales archaeon]